MSQHSRLSKDKHRRVDDTLTAAERMLMAAPGYDCYRAITDANRSEFAGAENSGDIHVPVRSVFNQKKARELAQYENLIILCGHMRSRQKVIDEICDEEISVGDYVLTGGEIPACIVTDAWQGFVPGCCQTRSATRWKAFRRLLEYPQYTRPFKFHGVRSRRC